jgi:hypothetical protein
LTSGRGDVRNDIANVIFDSDEGYVIDATVKIDSLLEVSFVAIVFGEGKDEKVIDQGADEDNEEENWDVGCDAVDKRCKREDQKDREECDD